MKTLPVMALPSLEQLEPRALFSAGAVDAGYVAAFAGQRNYAPSEDLVAMQVDGKSIHYARLSASTPTIWREMPNGSLDKSFGSGGKIITSETVKDLAVQSGGEIIALFQSSDPKEIHVARYTVNGTPDSSFGPNGQSLISSHRSVSLNALAVQNDGKILLAGSAGNDAVVYRLNKNGKRDNSFGSHGAAFVRQRRHFAYVFNDIAVGLGDNRIVAVGDQEKGGWSADWAVFVLNSKGRVRRRLDQPTTGRGFTGGTVTQVAIDGNGAVVVLGQVSYSNLGLGLRATTSDILARYPADLRGPADAVEPDYHGPIAVQTDGRILIAHWQGVTRFNQALSRDNTFVTNLPPMEFLATAIAVQPDGNLLIDGESHPARQAPFGTFASIRLSGD